MHKQQNQYPKQGDTLRAACARGVPQKCSCFTTVSTKIILNSIQQIMARWQPAHTARTDV
eukprot:2928751-Pleurochrysis_carterae.AAC.4